MENFEALDLFSIIAIGVWMRYEDDVLVIVPKNTNIEQKLTQLNEGD